MSPKVAFVECQDPRGTYFVVCEVGVFDSVESKLLVLLARLLQDLVVPLLLVCLWGEGEKRKRGGRGREREGGR